MNQLASDYNPLPLPAPDHSLPPHPSDQLPPQLSSQSSAGLALPPQLASIPPYESGFTLPSTPITPFTPSTSSFPSSDAKPRKVNPLNDLIDTEKAYVDQLTGIIRIDDLNTPYTNYCTKFRCGFDAWDPVQSNPKLANILMTFSTSNPPPSSAISSHATVPPVWTMDDLFLLPKARLKYYKKLYNRLLKSTAPGKSDHKLLVGALETLDRLMNTLENRSTVKVGALASPAPPAPPIHEPEDEVVIDPRIQSMMQQQAKKNEDRLSAEPMPASESSSPRASSVSGGERLSHETTNTSVSRESSSTLSMPISDLERRMSTQRTLDIFTMNPKVVRLQMAPPSLTFTRELRVSTDVVIRFIPQSTGVEVVHSLGHIFLLSDLFLVSERMTPEDRAMSRSDGADMWLCYPPLAGKVLRIFEVPDQPTAFKVTIMRKETLVLETESVEARDTLMGHFRDCIEFSQSLPPPSKVAPPPVPHLNGFGGPSSGLPNPQALSSPDNSSPPGIPRTTQPIVDGRIVDNVSKLVLAPDTQIHQGVQRATSIQEPPGPMYSRTSNQQFTNGSNAPGQMSGQPMRSASYIGQGAPRPGSAGPAGPGPGGFMQHPPGSQYGPPPPFQQPFGPNQPFSPNRPGQYGLPPGPQPPAAPFPPQRPPSEPGSGFGRLPDGGLRKSTSTHSLASQYSRYEQNQAPPVPAFPGGYPPNHTFLPRSSSYSSLPAPQARPLLPSLQHPTRSVSMAEPSFDEPSPPGSPVEETPRHTGPVTSTISAQMKCKVFLQQQHSQWKSLGSAKLKLYRQDPTNIKQLVVEADDKNKSIIISTIVLTDGVERVGKTGVAIELSDKGARTGIIYMIQLRNEKSAGGLFDSLLHGSDRAARG
ncbi:hypothetical protein H0H81_007518 [Sphagnurus paluster]|uniref:DH domain-containing protein n=1 Tax=Sphagnurus paluster TaxID=117069 RepID=A0A9P7KLE4_9AGAR|nr:hypothetical protein H0H81_007518 [Sphagnurus paluster]